MLRSRGKDPVTSSNWRALAAAAVLGTFGVLLGACGGGSGSPGVASLGSTTTTTTVSSAAQGAASAPKVQMLVNFVQCMRHHGVPGFPMPNTSASTPGHHVINLSISPAIAKSPQFRTAQSHCQSLLPNGGQGPTITPADEADYLKGVACMRSHGFPSFPDPTISEHSVRFSVPPGIDQNSPKFKQAVTTCEKLIPAGLPYSGNQGS